MRKIFGPISWNRVATTTLLMLFAGNAHAYKLTCDWVFTEKLEVFEQADSPQRVMGAIERYNKIMGFTEITHKPQSLDAVKLRLRKLNEAEKMELRAIIKEHYNEVKSLKYNKDGPFKTFKRHLDLIVSQELNAPQFFRDQIYKKNKSLEETLDLYYKKMQELTGIPVLLEGKDVLMTAIRLQDKFSSKFDSPIVIYGSFVNGKAYSKSSDLDFAVMNPKLETWMRETDLLTMLEDFPLSEAQAHTIGSNQVNGLGYLNPLVMIVRKNYIVLRVYENALFNDFKKNQVRFDEFYF